MVYEHIYTCVQRRAFLDEIEHKPASQRTKGEKSYLAKAREMGMAKTEQ